MKRAMTQVQNRDDGETPDRGRHFEKPFVD